MGVICIQDNIRLVKIKYAYRNFYKHTLFLRLIIRIFNFLSKFI